MTKRITKAELMRLRDLKMTNKSIALFFNCSLRTIERYVTKYKLSPKRVDIDAQTLVELRTSEPKVTWAQIAKMHNCSLRTVYGKRREYEAQYGIKIP